MIEALIAKQIFHINLVQLQSYAKKHCSIEDTDEFAGMISFYHGLGMVIKHRSTVVLKAQWLIDLLNQLITIPHFDKMVGQIMPILEIKAFYLNLIFTSSGCSDFLNICIAEKH